MVHPVLYFWFRKKLSIFICKDNFCFRNSVIYILVHRAFEFALSRHSQDKNKRFLYQKGRVCILNNVYMFTLFKYLSSITVTLLIIFVFVNINFLPCIVRMKLFWHVFTQFWGHKYVSNLKIVHASLCINYVQYNRSIWIFRQERKKSV